MNLQKKNNSIIYLIIIIVVLLMILVGVVLISFRIDTINRKSGSDLKYKFDLRGQNYTKEDLINFLESAKECKNYSFEYLEAGNMISGEVYNNRICYSNNYEDTYYNFSTKEMVIVSNNNKTYTVLNTELDDKYKNILANVILAFLKCEESEIKFIKFENYKGFDCIVEKVSIDDIKKVEELGLYSEEQIESLKKYDRKKMKISYEFWIDQKTGLLPKYDIVIESVDKKENRIEYDTNLKVNSVKKEDVDIPKEEDYKDYQIIK